jgi:hypothetical protein
MARRVCTGAPVHYNVGGVLIHKTPLAWLDKGAAHGHEEAVEDVDAVHLAAIEAAAEFDERARLLGTRPPGAYARLLFSST